MRYAVFVYSMPLSDPTEEDEGNEAHDAWVIRGEGLAELIADEGVQRKPVIVDERGLEEIEAALESNELHLEMFND